MRKCLKYFILSILSAALLFNVTACNKNSGEETVESERKSSRSKKTKKESKDQKTADTQDKELSDIKPLNYLTYAKDGSLYYDKLDGSEASKVFDFNPEGVEVMYVEIGTELTKNQNRLIYIKGKRYELFAGDLCYRDIDKDGNLSDEVLIAKEVNDFAASADGDIILYMCGTEYNSNILYEYDAKSAESTKVANGGYYFRVSDDGKRAVYRNENDILFERNVGEQRDERVDEAMYIYGMVGDLEKYYYIDEGKLYIKEFGKESELIDEHVQDISKVYKNGEIYYEKMEDDSAIVDMENLIVDDMQVKDDEILSKADTLIENMEYPFSDQYASDEEYQKALNIYHANEQLRFDLELVEFRNKYRYNVEDYGGATVKRYALYYYDTEKTRKIGDWVTGSYYPGEYYGYGFPYHINDEEPMILFNEFDHTGSEKFNMSDLFTFDSYDYSLAQAAMLMRHKTKVAVEGEVLELEFPQDALRMIAGATYAKDNKSVYVSKVENAYDYYNAELYKVKLGSSDRIKGEFVAENVSAYEVQTTKNGDVYYETGGEDMDESNLWKNFELLYEGGTLYDISDDERCLHISINRSQDIAALRDVVFIDGKEILLDEESEVYVKFDENNNIIFTKTVGTGLFNDEIYIYDKESGKKLIAEDATLVNIERVAEDYMD